VHKVAKHTDPNLVNPWGFTFMLGDLLVANNHSGTAEFYDKGKPDDLMLGIPSPAGPGNTSSPTDVAFNALALHFIPGFDVPVGTNAFPSLVMFSTEDGTIASWVPFRDSRDVVLAVDNSAAGAVYKSLVLVPATLSASASLFVANFKQGHVEMYDDSFNLVKTFTDPSLPAGFAPFGMRLIRGQLFVTFAQQLGPDNEDDAPGAGAGYVDVFDTSGNLVTQLVAGGELNAPWGLALAPLEFGKLGGSLLVGNFGDGTINAYDPTTGAFKATLRDKNGHVIRIDGLWGLGFDPESRDELTFTAGPGGENHGLLGVITPED
jgi:uncharacterized protein (TIGR03118 family)